MKQISTSDFIKDKDEAWFLAAQKWLDNIKKNGVPKYIQCGCGHSSKDHYQGRGWCHHSEHPKAGECGCTWFWPNDKYQGKRQLYKKALSLHKRRQK